MADQDGWGNALKTAAKAMKSPPSANPPMPGLMFLGSGFDSLGPCHPSSKKANIFDFENADQDWKNQVFVDASLAGMTDRAMQSFNSVPNAVALAYRMPALVDFVPKFEGDVYTLETSSMSELQQSLGLAAEADISVGLFAGELSARFAMSKMQLSSTRAYSVTAQMVYASLSMGNYNQTTPAPMRAGAQEDLDGVRTGGRKVLSPKQILDTYGSHYVSKFDLGTMIVLGFTNDESKNTQSIDLAASLKARFGTDGEGGGGSLSAEMKQSLAAQQSNIDQRIRFWGVDDAQLDSLNLLAAAQGGGGPAGNAPEGGKEDKGGSTTPVSLLKEGWHNPTLIGIPADGLVGIWTLCKDRTRAKAIHQEFVARRDRVIAGLPEKAGRLQPMYRIRGVGDQNTVVYRFNTSVRIPTDDDNTGPYNWKDDNGSSPVCYLYTSQAPGRVPLFAWRFHGGAVYRYDTATWEDWINTMGEGAWLKVSGNPLGYVIDGLGVTQPPPGTVAVYAYYPKNDGNYPRFRYSTDSADSADSGGWEFSLRIDRKWEIHSTTVTAPTGRGLSTEVVAKFPKLVDFPASSPHWYAPTLPSATASS